MIDRVVQSNGKEVTISQDLSLSHAGTVWDGALCMISFWNKNGQVAKSILKDKNVLELGSGTGVLGLVACTFKPQSICLTDLPEYQSILQHNVNQNKWDENTTKPTVKPLKWGTKQHIADIQHIDTIIGSQLSYDKYNAQLLMETIQTYRQINPNLNVMISYQKYKEQWKNIQSLYKQYFGVQSYKLVAWDEMDHNFRDPYIGILCSI